MESVAFQLHRGENHHHVWAVELLFGVTLVDLVGKVGLGGCILGCVLIWIGIPHGGVWGELPGEWGAAHEVAEMIRASFTFGSLENSSDVQLDAGSPIAILVGWEKF
jgi:hypothetical protein